VGFDSIIRSVWTDGVPLNGFAALMNIHYLGFKVEQLLYATLHPNYSAIDYRVRNLVVVVGTTIVLWSVIAFVVISIVRRLMAGKWLGRLTIGLQWTPRLRSVCMASVFGAAPLKPGVLSRCDAMDISETHIPRRCRGISSLALWPFITRPLFGRAPNSATRSSRDRSPCCGFR